MCTSKGYRGFESPSLRKAKANHPDGTVGVIFVFRMTEQNFFVKVMMKTKIPVFREKPDLLWFCWDLPPGIAEGNPFSKIRLHQYIILEPVVAHHIDIRRIILDHILPVPKGAGSGIQSFYIDFFPFLEFAVFSEC